MNQLKKFFIRILSFALIITFLTGIVEVMLLFRPNTYSYKKEYVVKHSDDIKCLLLGNSHIEEALNPSVMGEGVFNLARAGRVLVYDIELAKMFVPPMANLKVLVLPLDYNSFYFGREVDNPEEVRKIKDTRNGTSKCMHYKYMGIRVDEFWYWSEFLNSKEDFLSRFIKNKNESIECDSLGFIALKLSDRKVDWKNRALPQPIDNTKSIDEQKYETLYNQYLTVARLANNKKVRLVLLSTPMYETSLKYINTSIEEEIITFVRKLQKDYPSIEYYNYCDDKRFDEDDFFDSSHLTENGALKFSKIFKEEVLDSNNLKQKE